MAEALKERIADGEQILYFCPESDGDGFSFDSDIVFFGVDPAEASFENWADQFTKLLKKDGLQLGVGSKGDDVAAIQEYLIALGCLSDAANGVFGPGTEKAVKQFQDDKYLDATGIVDDETRETLFAMELPRNWM